MRGHAGTVDGWTAEVSVGGHVDAPVEMFSMMAESVSRRRLDDGRLVLRRS